MTFPQIRTLTASVGRWAPPQWPGRADKLLTADTGDDEAAAEIIGRTLALPAGGEDG